MGKVTAEEKLELIDKALKYFYSIDADTLIDNYNEALSAKEKKKEKVEVDKETAKEFFQIIPEKCYEQKGMDMREEMLIALTENEFKELCDEQVKAHPDIDQEIRSMFEFCIKIKNQIEID